MIFTRSSFYYGYDITAEPFNGRMEIDEGSGSITVDIPVGSYTFTTLAAAIQNALNTQATLEYTVTIDRTARFFTIAATANFDLLTNTAATIGQAPWDLLGFDTSSDLTGANTYTSISPSGKEYTPQFLLQSFVGDDDFQRLNLVSKNVASDGVTVETVAFGLAKFIQIDIKFITNRRDVADCVNIEHNPTGVEDARDFLQNITRIKEFEFNFDRQNPGTFRRCIVESMPDFQDGTGYRLRELFNQDLTDIYETGVITLRVIE